MRFREATCSLGIMTGWVASAWIVVVVVVLLAATSASASASSTSLLAFASTRTVHDARSRTEAFVAGRRQQRIKLRRHEPSQCCSHRGQRHPLLLLRASAEPDDVENAAPSELPVVGTRHVTIVGAGWAGLSAAEHLLRSNKDRGVQVTLVEASPRVGGLVRDGFKSVNSTTSSTDQPTAKRRVAEAGQHGFWNNYRNIFRFLRHLYPEDAGLKGLLTDLAAQGQFSPRGLEAVWPVYQAKEPQLPTGLAQLLYTDFVNLPLQDRLSALPLALAFADFDETDEDSWRKYDATSFWDLRRQHGVSKRCYDEAFEPMILTGLFAPGRECSAAAALGMARFFVMQSQAAFDVRWCRGNIGERIFEPWIRQMQAQGLHLELSTRVEQFEIRNDTIASVMCRRDDGSTFGLPTDHVIMAVSAKALQSIARTSPNLARSHREFRGFANLRGTSVVATRLYLNKNVTVTYSANACWGFHRDVGMTMFDIRALHGPDHPPADPSIGSVVEVDYYYANSLLALSDDDLVRLVKRDLDNLLGIRCEQATVVDAAVVRLPDAVNWYFPGSYSYLPTLRSQSIKNLCYAGDVVKTNHRSWSQEKAFVTGIQAANVVLGRPIDQGVLPVDDDEHHVQVGRAGVRAAQSVLGCDAG